MVKDTNTASGVKGQRAGVGRDLRHRAQGEGELVKAPVEKLGT